VNQAGRGLSGGGPIELSDPEEVADMVQVNLLGVYNCTYAVLPSMIARSRGHIVNISSVVGKVYFPQSPMYSATKFALRAFSEGLRNQVQEWNIRVTTVYPGQTDTTMLKRFTPAERNKFLKPKHIAMAIVHALEYPENVSINEIVIRPTWQEE
jgi:NADP-dependent 3-hydroxy acid dehydrogenase YdfG